jgi:hypothetical protein
MINSFSRSFIAIGVLFTAVAYAQQPSSERYASAIFLKVAPEKEPAVADFYKTGLGAKALRARMKADPTFTGWSLRRLAYGGVVAPESNYVIVASMNGAPAEPDPVKRDAMYRAAIDMSYADYMQRVRALSQVVGNVLAHVHDMTPDYSVNEGDVVLSRRIKVADGKLGDLSDLNHNQKLAIMTERVKSGDIKGWAFSHLSSPTGSEMPFDATETLVFKDMASALARSARDNSGMTLFAKLFPTKSFTRYVEDQRAYGKVMRVDSYRVVAAVRQ